MRQVAKISACFAVICLASVAAPVAAQEDEGVPEITVSPLEGGPGTEIQVSGSDCPPEGWDDEGELEWSVHVRGDAPDRYRTLEGSVTPPSDADPETMLAFELDLPPLGGADTTPDADGNWSVTLTVGDAVMAPPGEYVITATCASQYVEHGILVYTMPQAFQVLAADEPPAPPEPAPKPAPEPAPSEPRFTG